MVLDKPAAKGGADVVWRTDFYIAEAKRQLSDTSSYLPLDKYPAMTHQAIVSPTVTDLISSGDLPRNASKLKDPSPAQLVRGVAMVTHMYPSYACLFVGYGDHFLFQSYSGPYPQHFLQYIDNIIGAASLSRLQLEKLINFSSNFHPTITFTWSTSDFSLPFLDISVSISGNRLATNIHYKPTDSHSYLDY
eukprot:g44718.t1